MEKHNFHKHINIFILLFLLPYISLAIDTISPKQPLSINQALVSSNQRFELGFFTTKQNKNNSYMGIWYKNIPEATYVWVANRNTPLTTSTGKLTIGENGNIILTNEAESTVWSTNMSFSVNTVAQLLDNGNFVLRDVNDENSINYIWQSFEHPTDTLLPGMKLGLNQKTGVNRALKSWKTNDDPGEGEYSFKMDTNGFPQVFLWKNVTEQYRSGPWNGRRFSGVPEIKSATNLIEFEFLNDSDDISFSFHMLYDSVYSRLIMTPSGTLQHFTWVETSQTWSEYRFAPHDRCDFYGQCGPYGICDMNSSPGCKCMQGFRPKSKQSWDLRDGSDGCVRSSDLYCETDGFLPYKNMKLPESSQVFVNQTMNLTSCGMICKKNCSCAAYANMDITRGGSGCVIWEVDLFDMRQYADSEGGGQDLYVRAAASDLDRGRHSVRMIFLIAALGAGVVMILIIIILCLKKRYGWRKNGNDNVNVENFLKNHEFLAPKRYSYSQIKKMTNSLKVKLGQGGFGSVYRGELGGGNLVAVKILSELKGNGEDFVNEVASVGRTCHVNIVSLVGFCVEGGRRALIYEFMPNGSLEKFIYDRGSSSNSHLGWEKLHQIAIGIARGLEYLHRGCNTRILHFDIKPHNILLDKDLCPKISDFGLAKLFPNERSKISMSHMRGTPGYIAPELFSRNFGQVSNKSDVYSYGMMILEMFAGQKNVDVEVDHSSDMYFPDWIYKRIEFNEEQLGLHGIVSEEENNMVRKTIIVGLWCIQTNPLNRPTITRVLEMLEGDLELLEIPPKPYMSSPSNPVGSSSPTRD